jgi:hypothetical protein
MAKCLAQAWSPGNRNAIGLSRRGAPDLPLATRLTANVRGSTMSMGVGVKVCLNSPELQ